MILRFLQASEGGMGGCPLRPGRHWLSLTQWNPQWGARPVGRLPTLPLVYFLAPYPPDPLPRWGRGRL